ncbi:MAG: Hsp70 family protein [Desulfobacterales bacterium]|nr:Hsp70 family protein [Desulfobacterales bacterium]
MSYAIGIDLGTTNSVISVYRRGVVETLLSEGRSAMPSVVSFCEDGKILVGHSAKARMLIDPENTVSSSKRFMGERNKYYYIGDKKFSPVNIASIILKKLIENAKCVLGENVSNVAITVPAYFTEAQKEDTKKAGEEAGFNVLRLIPEPTSAAIAYGLDREKDQTIMVYDLGGGTFDVSVLEVRGNSFNVKAVGGNSQLGGDDFDQAIINWVSIRFKEQTGIDIIRDNSRDGKIVQQRLKEAVESAKLELSESENSFITLPNCLGHSLNLEISLTEYNKLIAPLLQHTVDCMKAVLMDAHLTPRDIDRVIQVGGSTKNRMVRDIISQHVKEPYVAERVDEVVSHGAAIVAANLFLPEEKEMRPIEISDVTGHSTGVDLLNNGEVIFKPIIPRQSNYPCRMGILAYTTRPMQDVVEFCVYQGENPKPDQNTYKGELHLPISPPRNEIVPVGAVFELDTDGIIHFTAVQFPLSKDTDPIIDFAEENDGRLSLSDTDNLINSGKAKTRSVKIKVDK